VAAAAVTAARHDRDPIAVACLRAHPYVANVSGDCDYIDEHGRKIDAHPTTPFDYAALLRTARSPIPQLKYRHSLRAFLDGRRSKVSR